MTGTRPHVRDADRLTLHIRCGSDIRAGLREAGLCGPFLEFSDPFCQGPVPALDGDGFVDRRARFIAEAYGLAFAEARERLAGQHRALARARLDHERVVLWFEHDHYDQLILACVLAALATQESGCPVELICIDRFPGVERFIGLGQLPPNSLAILWDQRVAVGGPLFDLGSRVWAALREPSPERLHAIAASSTPALPLMARALMRHLQELPWTTDGLSLTQRLALVGLVDGASTAGRLFRDFVRHREPLPYLGDLMFWAELVPMAHAERPALRIDPVDDDEPSAQRRLSLTETGRDLVEGRADWLSFSPAERWVGGVATGEGQDEWRWDPYRRRPVAMA
jgi:hypothetical protein